MVSIGFFELVVVGGVALVVLKPEDWPALFRKLGTLMRMVKTFQTDLKKSYTPFIEEIKIQEFSKNAQEKAEKKEPLVPTTKE